MNSLYEKLAPVLLVAVIALSFAVGILWQKVSGIEKGGGAAVSNTANASPLSEDALIGYAKDIGLDKKEFTSCLENNDLADEVANDVAYGQELGVAGTPAFFINGIFVGGAYPYNLFKAIIDFELAGGDWSNPDETVADLVDGDPNNGEIVVDRKDVDLGNDPTMGDENAPITIVEFSDFECPYCESFYSNTLSQIEENYVNSGKVRLVYKDFPLTQIHPNAQRAAEAAGCALKQGKFWEMHDAMFEAQKVS